MITCEVCIDKIRIMLPFILARLFQIQMTKSKKGFELLLIKFISSFLSVSNDIRNMKSLSKYDKNKINNIYNNM